MNQDKMIEALAKRMAFAARERNDVSEDATEFWVYTGDAAKDKWMKVAATVLELMRPKRLVWQKSNHRTQFAIFTYLANGFVIEQRLNGTDFDLWVGPDATKAERFATLELAQSAAQAHADAAWLASLPLGELVGGD